jgi:dipeptidyl-peptidase 4
LALRVGDRIERVIDDSFPRLQARTARFTLGRPRGFVVSPDGLRVVFMRSQGGTDRVTCLWSHDVATGAETLLADPRALLAAGSPDAAHLPASERALRERAREQAAGIVGYSTDSSVAVAAFTLSGRLFVTALEAATDPSGAVRELPVGGPVFDPRIDPMGRTIAYASGGALRVVAADGGDDRELIAEAGVSWGVAEFVAAEEMGRQRGFWWAPDGASLLAARVDESGVQEWYIGDPSNPDRLPNKVRYPAAGTPNALVSLSLLHLDGRRVDLSWDREAFPYLVNVRWRRWSAPLLQVAARDQRTMRIVEVDVTTGATTVLREDTDPHWLEVVAGVPDRLPDGRLVSTVDLDDSRRLVVGDQIVTPPGLQVHAILALTPDDILFSASTEPTEQHVWRYRADGECAALTSEPGVHTGTGAGSVLVVNSASLSDDGVRTTVRNTGGEVGQVESGQVESGQADSGQAESEQAQSGQADSEQVESGHAEVAQIASVAEPAPFSPRVSISKLGRRELRTALVLPRDHIEGSAPLPVLMDPYGGPHAQRVLASRGAYLNAQWLADQGFAVVIADGRGTPSRGIAWERAVSGDFATAVLEDQVDALHAVAAEHSDLDLTRVGIRGWSFGGYLAALAVLRRPDVFHAAVAGAPVTDWSLYDTHYTERYLGTDTSATSYAVSSLLNDAAALTRPLMLVHGLADDNVVAAHTLRLSAALLAGGRPHSVLPLSGVTHMQSQEDVAANLVKLEVEFLKNALGV